MGLNAKKVAFSGGNNGPKQEAIEAGTYPARVVQVLDLGLQPQRPYKGEEKPPAHEIQLTYEFVDEFCLDEDGKEMEDKPRWLSESMPFRSLESDLAKSTKRYHAIDPDGTFDGDFTLLVGATCMVTITCKPNQKGEDRNYVNSVSFMRPKEAAKCPELVNPPKVFLLDEPDLEVLGSLPKWLQEKIESNLEYAGSALDAAQNGGGAKKEEPKKEKPKKEEPEAEDDSDDKW